MNTFLTEAWRTIVPAKDDKNGPLAPILLALTVVTGLVDAFSYLVLGHVFVANMTGNVVFLAFALAGAPGFSVVASLAALGAFSVGALVGGRLGAAFGHDRGRLLVIVGTLEALFAAVSVLVVSVAHNPGSGGARYILIVILSLSMGAQNATARRSRSDHHRVDAHDHRYLRRQSIGARWWVEGGSSAGVGVVDVRGRLDRCPVRSQGQSRCCRCSGAGRAVRLGGIHGPAVAI